LLGERAPWHAAVVLRADLKSRLSFMCQPATIISGERPTAATANFKSSHEEQVKA
jgi:hypothetical protein